MRTSSSIPIPSHRELLTAVLAGEVASVSPVMFWQHHPIADQNGETLAQATLAFQHRFDCDLVKITPASTFQVRDYGLTDTWQGDSLGRRAIGPGIISNPDAWYELPQLRSESGFISRHLQCAVQVRRCLPASIPVIQSIFNPLFQVAVLAEANFTNDLEYYPQHIEAGLAIVTANTVAFIHALRELANIDGIYLVTQHARSGAVTQEQYLRFGVPYDLACLQAAAGLPFNMLHLHGEGVYTDLVRDYPINLLHYALDASNPRPEQLLVDMPMAISTGPNQFGAINRGTVAEAAAETKRLLQRLKGSRFALGAGCVLPLDTPEANIHAAIVAARTPRPDRVGL